MIYRATVVDNADPSKALAVRVQCSELYGSRVSGWVDACVPVEGSAVPDIGTNVWLVLQGNDPTEPVWIGTWMLPGEGVFEFVLPDGSIDSPDKFAEGVVPESAIDMALYDSAEIQRILAAVVARQGGYGVGNTAHMRVSQGAGLSVNIAAGEFVREQSSGVAQLLINESVANAAVPVVPTSIRVDTVYVQPGDDLFESVFATAQGTVGTVDPPTLPVDAEPLAHLVRVVGEGTTISVINDARKGGSKHQKKSRTAGNVTVSSTSFATVDAVTDITVAAEVGDVIEVCVDGIWSNEARDARLDVIFVDSGAHFGTAVEGIMGAIGVASAFGPFNVTARRTTVIGDFNTTSVAGSVVVRVVARVTTAGSKTLLATTDLPLTFSARNLGLL